VHAAPDFFATSTASAAPSDSETTSSEPTTTVDYPTKPITVVLPYSAGGDTDVAARTIAKYLPDYLGQNVVVTNVTGSSGGVAINQVAESDPDGYTILMHHTAMLNGTMLGLTEKGIRRF
jgi:tripartite-type tricarboxylate transporter receptor subunit TctC